MRVKLDIPLSLGEIAAYLKSPCSSPKKKIKHICTDTRELCRNDLFIPLSGTNYSGECFVSQATRMGAYTLSSSYPTADISVSNTRQALLKIAECYKERLTSLKATFLITGSVGKSTTKEMLFRLLCKKYTAHKTQGNFNNDIGLPLSILSSPKNCEALVLEVGMNHPGEISPLSLCAKPNIAIITNIGTAHIGNLGSREAIATEKSAVTHGMSENDILICEYEEPLLESIRNRKTVSSQNFNADFYFSNIRHSYDGTRFDFTTDRLTARNLFIPLYDTHMSKNAFMAISAAAAFCPSEAFVREGCLRLLCDCERSKTVRVGGLMILDDSYNSSPESAEASLSKLQGLGELKYSALLGDMLELGDNAAALHRRIGASAAKRGLSSLFLIGEHCNSYKDGAISEGFSENNIFVNFDTADVKKTALQIVNNTEDGELILFKASNAVRLSRVIDAIRELKG